MMLANGISQGRAICIFGKDRVFFGGEGVIAETSQDEHRKVIKYNHLVANCLIYHNVCSLTRILRALEHEGPPAEADALGVLSPYLTNHIYRFGDYTLDMERTPPRPDYGYTLRGVA